MNCRSQWASVQITNSHKTGLLDGVSGKGPRSAWTITELLSHPWRWLTHAGWAVPRRLPWCCPYSGGTPRNSISRAPWHQHRNGLHRRFMKGRGNWFLPGFLVCRRKELEVTRFWPKETYRGLGVTEKQALLIFYPSSLQPITSPSSTEWSKEVFRVHPQGWADAETKQLCE